MTSPDQLRTALSRLESARPAMRRPMRDSANAVALQLTAERDALVARMDRRWAWLDAHEGHPQFVEREDALLADIATYTRIEDALREAASVLYGGSAA